MVRNMINYFM